MHQPSDFESKSLVELEKKTRTIEVMVVSDYSRYTYTYVLGELREEFNHVQTVNA